MIDITPAQRCGKDDSGNRKPVGINFREDFVLDMRILDAKGDPTLPPDVDFVIRLFAGKRIFNAGRRKGECHNCTIKDETEAIVTVIADGHGLGPCRSLDAEIILYIPDPEMPDGIRTVSRKFPTGFALTLAESDLPAQLETAVRFPVISSSYKKKQIPQIRTLAKGRMPLYPQPEFAYEVTFLRSVNGEIKKINLLKTKLVDHMKVMDLSKMFDWDDPEVEEILASSLRYGSQWEIPYMGNGKFDVSDVGKSAYLSISTEDHGGADNVLGKLGLSLNESGMYHLEDPDYPYSIYVCVDENGRIRRTDSVAIPNRPRTTRPIRTISIQWSSVPDKDGKGISSLRIYVNGCCEGEVLKHRKKQDCLSRKWKNSKYEIQFYNQYLKGRHVFNRETGEYEKQYSWSKIRPQSKWNCHVFSARSGGVARIRLKGTRMSPPGEWTYFIVPNLQTTGDEVTKVKILSYKSSQ